MVWITPKLDWQPSDYYNFEDLNRVENNTEVIAELIAAFGIPPVITTITDREMVAIELAVSLNRIEGNINALGQKYKPLGWEENKLDWRANTPFDYQDAIRLEKNLALLHFYYRGNMDNFRYCGAYTCGEEVI